MDTELEAKYKETWNQYYGGIRKFCFYRLNQNLVDDCCQEIFQAYLEALLKNIKIQNTRSWLYKVANNIICKMTKQAEFELALVDDPDCADMDTLHVEYDYLEEIIRRKYTDDEIIQIVKETLTDEEKLIFEECFLEQQDTTFVSNKLHITTNYLYKKKWALRQKLEQRIQKVVEDIKAAI